MYMHGQILMKHRIFKVNLVEFLSGLLTNSLACFYSVPHPIAPAKLHMAASPASPPWLNSQVTSYFHLSVATYQT